MRTPLQLRGGSRRSKQSALWTESCHSKGAIIKSCIHANDDRMISLSARRERFFTTQFRSEELQPGCNVNTALIIGPDGWTDSSLLGLGRNAATERDNIAD